MRCKLYFRTVCTAPSVFGTDQISARSFASIPSIASSRALKALKISSETAKSQFLFIRCLKIVSAFDGLASAMHVRFLSHPTSLRFCGKSERAQPVSIALQHASRTKSLGFGNLHIISCRTFPQLLHPHHVSWVRKLLPVNFFSWSRTRIVVHFIRPPRVAGGNWTRQIITDPRWHLGSWNWHVKSDKQSQSVLRRGPSLPPGHFDSFWQLAYSEVERTPF